ncbi:hypothetical protein D0T60_11355 [Bacteroides sp. 224]|nr:hypothetical protein [Bacteroides sp. 224]
MLSKSNSSFIKKTVLVKLIIYSLLTQFKLQSLFFNGTLYVFLSTIKYNSLCCSSIVSGCCLVFPEEGNITFI